MRTTVYPNTENFVMSDCNKLPLSAAVDNILQLSDAERIKITQIFLRQLPLCCLTRRADRVVVAIFNQTINFNKFEDDMNGPRLQQLTTLHPHHANEVVRYLEDIHVLITRKGQYGKYLSLNFNFSQWGKEGDECDGVITNDPRIMLDKAHFVENNRPKPIKKRSNIAAEEREYARKNPANQAFEPQANKQTNKQTGYEQDLLKDLLVAIGRIEVSQNVLSKKHEAFVADYAQQQAAFKKTSDQQQAAFKKTSDQQQAAFEKASDQQQVEFEKAFIQQQAGLEETVKRLIKEALTTTKQTEQYTEQHTEQTANKNEVTTPPVVTPQPTSEPVIEAVVEPETDKQPIEKAQPHQEMTATLPSSVPTESHPHTEALMFPSRLSQDQRHDAKKLLQRADNDMQQVLLDMLSKRMLNTSNPVNSPIAYLTNLLIRLENNRLDMPLSAMPSVIGSVGTGSIAAPEIPPLRDSERRRAEYQEAVADCIQMENNIKLMGRNDSLTFGEALDKFDMRGLWNSICERFTETKEALAAIQPLNALPV